MVYLYILAVITEYILLLAVPAFSKEANITLFIKSVGFPICIKGEQYFDVDQNKCRRCPRCRKASNYLQFKIRIGQQFGALDCYPCYCKPGEKFYDEYSGKCSICPGCNMYGYIDTSQEIHIDEFYGALNCSQCVCDQGYFANVLTHHQCAECYDCHGQNREFITPCTQDTDSECGDCLVGYENLGIDNAACVQIQKTVASELASSTTTTISNSGHIGVIRSHTILIVILVMVTFSAACIICIVYRIINHPACCNFTNDVTPPVSATTLISTTSAMKNSYRQGELNVGSTAAAIPLLSGNTDIEQNDDVEEQLDSDGLLSSNQIENVMETSDERNVVVIYQKGDSCAVHINSPQESPS
ncbi:uncharacterized protein LOC143085074 [Mytilus galloprovincialis]|uniref:uncharacterized protein LOC143085074 n=1 Tax=Mytilus galloprovincialis TaxID=29158 RepID=UPI003F7B6B96